MYIQKAFKKKPIDLTESTGDNTSTRKKSILVTQTTVGTIGTPTNRINQLNRPPDDKTQETTPFCVCPFESSANRVDDRKGKSCIQNLQPVLPASSDNSAQNHNSSSSEANVSEHSVHSHAQSQIVRIPRLKKSKLIALKKINALLIKFFLNEDIEPEHFSQRPVELHILVELLIRKNRAYFRDK